MTKELHWTETPTDFERVWNRARECGIHSGLTANDPYTASLWYHQGAVDMAREFAAGQGAVLAKLDAIEKAILNAPPIPGEDS